jgi:hypothetical protein
MGNQISKEEMDRINTQLIGLDKEIQNIISLLQKKQEKEKTFKSIIFSYLPINRKRARSMEEDILRVEYSILQMQKQILHIIKGVSSKVSSTQVDDPPKKGDVMYG